MDDQNRMIDESIINPAIDKMGQISETLATILHEFSSLPFGNAGSMQSTGQNAENMKMLNLYASCGIIALIGIVENTQKFLNDVVTEYNSTDDTLAG